MDHISYNDSPDKGADGPCENKGFAGNKMKKSWNDTLEFLIGDANKVILHVDCSPSDSAIETLSTDPASPGPQPEPRPSTSAGHDTEFEPSRLFGVRTSIDQAFHGDFVQIPGKRYESIADIIKKQNVEVNETYQLFSAIPEFAPLDVTQSTFIKYTERHTTYSGGTKAYSDIQKSISNAKATCSKWRQVWKIENDKVKDEVVRTRNEDRVNAACVHMHDFIQHYNKLSEEFFLTKRPPSKYFVQGLLEKLFVVLGLCVTGCHTEDLHTGLLVSTMNWSNHHKTCAKPDLIVYNSELHSSTPAMIYVEVKKSKPTIPSQEQHEPRPKRTATLTGKTGERLKYDCIREAVGDVLGQHYLELIVTGNDTLFKTYRLEDGTKIAYLTKVGIIQQGTHINFVILKIPSARYMKYCLTGEAAKKRIRQEEKKRKTHVEPEPGQEFDNGEKNRKRQKRENSTEPKELEEPEKSTEKTKNVQFNFKDEAEKKSRYNYPEMWVSKSYHLNVPQDRLSIVSSLFLLMNIADHM